MAEDDSKFGIVADYNEQQRLGREEAETYIRMQTQALFTTGAQSSERDLFNQLLEQLKEGGDPFKIRKQAEDIVAGRALDH